VREAWAQLDTPITTIVAAAHHRPRTTAVDIMFAHCKGPFWGIDDFSTCFEREYVQAAVWLCATTTTTNKRRQN